jgi:hypothetical protein
MPASAWYVLIGAGLVVVVLALWKGRGLRVSKGKIEVDRELQVQVAEGIELRDAKVKDVIGVQGPAPVSGVAVMNNAKISGGEVGNIVGYRAESDRAEKT